MNHTAEHARLLASDRREAHWKRWGPYLSERQWGTVREDYSPNGDAWGYLPHDHARSRAYRWGEDGIAGFCDNHQRLCFALGLWNERDAILKERLFGLTNTEGNHGEDVKELYYYLDATPSHAYLKMLYKYPQAPFPYDLLVAENARRGREELEFELYDCGVFDEDRYFDIFVEYARADVDDILIRIRAHNRGPEPAPLHLLPQAWFRNTWAFGDPHDRPVIRREGPGSLAVTHHSLGSFQLECSPTRLRHGDGREQELEVAGAIFCENETNVRRLYGQRAPGPFKDGFHEAIVEGRRDAIHPERGTKAAFHQMYHVPAG
ncbi:MAG: glucosidase, partial [Myxococcota bacterium]